MNSNESYEQNQTPPTPLEPDRELTRDLWDNPEEGDNPAEAEVSDRPIIDLHLENHPPGDAEDNQATEPIQLQLSHGGDGFDAEAVSEHEGELTELAPPEIEETEPEEQAVLQVGGDDRVRALEERITLLQTQETLLKQRIVGLQQEYETAQEQLLQTQNAIGRLVQDGLSELEQRKKKLQITVEQLERRAERVRSEMKTSFAGVSQDLAIRVQGFKDYLVGSLQDLASAAEQLQLTPEVKEIYQAPPSNWENRENRESRPRKADTTANPKFAEQGFQEQVRQIRRILDQYRTMPDYYGPSWQLRRTFEPIHAERVSNWFFTQGGRGALKTMGSRLQNILIASATVSVLRSLYGDRIRPLILANSPERLGEWRRGLQDCLGLTRSDFSAESGVGLFEAPEPLAQKADRLVKNGQLPIIIIDESENQVNLSMLQFPLWLAFASDPEAPPMIY